MELELGLALPSSNNSMRGFDLNHDITHSYKKRAFEEAFGGDDEDNGSSTQLDNPHGLNNGRRVLVGWPPIKCTRRNAGNKCVKVKMEGMAIGRKVDLSLLHSYHSLFVTLYQMFPIQHDEKMGIMHAGAEQQQHFTVTYEDGDGDWMLVGDVPWETFIRSVKRLKVLVDQSH